MKKHIPNLLTGLNVMSGSMSVFMVLYGRPDWAALFILVGMFFDFFDGLAARLLHVKSEMGKELDSLADIVSFGLAPAVLAHLLIRWTLLGEEETSIWVLPVWQQFLLFLPLIIPFFSAFRLAKFNLDVRQSVSFIGMPVPAHALFWVSLMYARLYLPETYQILFGSVWVLAVSIVVLSLLLVSELPMFSLKISGFSWKNNKIRYLYFSLLVVLSVCIGWSVIVFIIPFYILFCVLEALLHLKQ